MNLCIDARWIFPEISGIGLYTQELIRALAVIDPKNRYLLLFNRQAVMERTIRETGLAGRPNFECRCVEYGLFSLASQLQLPKLLKAEHIDVFHSTNYMMPLMAPKWTRRVVTIHDLIPLLFRDHAPRSKKSRLFPIFKKLMHEIGRQADLIITVSVSTRRDVIKELAIKPIRQNRIMAIPEGVLPIYHPEEKAARVEPVILYVGRRDPYKNMPLLIEAFGRLKARGISGRLRIIGPADERYPEAPQRARELGLNDHIDWIGYVSPQDLIREYQQADVFVLPSRYEGFGLTVLEAMASGTPVICSNTSSLPEVTGDAALLIDPDSIDDLTNALSRVLTTPALAADLRERGLKRAAQFTWEQTARLTLQAYESALHLPS